MSLTDSIKEYKENTLHMAAKIRSAARSIDDGFPLDNYSKGILIDLYYVASLMYYQHDKSLLHDHSFDALCRFLYKNWAEGDPPKDDLDAGTGYNCKPPHSYLYVIAEGLN